MAEVELGKAVKLDEAVELATRDSCVAVPE